MGHTMSRLGFWSVFSYPVGQTSAQCRATSTSRVLLVFHRGEEACAPLTSPNTAATSCWCLLTEVRLQATLRIAAEFPSTNELLLQNLTLWQNQCQLTCLKRELFLR